MGPHLMVKQLIQPPHYHGHFILTQTKPLSVIFIIKLKEPHWYGLVFSTIGGDQINRVPLNQLPVDFRWDLDNDNMTLQWTMHHLLNLSKNTSRKEKDLNGK